MGRASTPLRRCTHQISLLSSRGQGGSQNLISFCTKYAHAQFATPPGQLPREAGRRRKEVAHGVSRGFMRLSFSRARQVARQNPRF